MVPRKWDREQRKLRRPRPLARHAAAQGAGNDEDLLEDWGPLQSGAVQGSRDAGGLSRPQQQRGPHTGRASLHPMGWNLSTSSAKPSRSLIK